MSGLKRRLFPSFLFCRFFESHEKDFTSMYECLRAVTLCCKCLTKRDKV